MLITTSTPGALQMGIFNPAGEDLTLSFKIVSFDTETFEAIVYEWDTDAQEYKNNKYIFQDAKVGPKRTSHPAI